MPRGKFKKHIVPIDPLYNSVSVSKLINQVMKKGKKSTAKRIVYKAFEILKDKTKKEPIEVFESALQNTVPLIEVRSKRIGGATYQVPHEVTKDRGLALSMRWIISAARSKKGKAMQEKLAEELIAASKNEGSAVKKREDVHRMAEANRAFAHFTF